MPDRFRTMPNVDWTELLSNTPSEDYMSSTTPTISVEPFVFMNKGLVIDDIQDQDISFNGATQNDRTSKKGAKIMRNYPHTFDLDGQQFPITRAGLYALTKKLLQKVVQENDSSYLRQHNQLLELWWSRNTGDLFRNFYPPQEVELYSMFCNVYDNLSCIKCLSDEERDVFYKLKNNLYYAARRVWDDCPRQYYYMQIDWIENLIYSVDGLTFKSETFQLNGHSYPRYLRKYVRRCPECGRLFLEQTEMEDRFSIRFFEKLNSSDIGYEGYCSDCVQDCYDCDLHQCDVSGKWFDESQLRYVENTEEMVCEDVIYDGDYRECDHCGNLIDCNSDNDGVWTDDNCFFCCEECAEREGYHWSESREEWTQDREDDEVNEIVGGYHTHRYLPVTSDKDRPSTHELLTGMELECDDHDRYSAGYEFFRTLKEDMLDDNVFFETDGSLNEGFEMITHPMTEMAFKEKDWDKACSFISDEGFRSHNTSTCGLHFHFSEWFLGYNNRQKRDSAKKIVRFFEDHWNDLVRFSRREDFGYCHRYNYSNEITQETKFSDLSCEGRYRAVNLTNLFGSRKSTIEIRICRGTLKASTLKASYDFFLHIVRNAKSVPWNKINDLSLWFKGIKDKNTIDYIKSRNCFEGCF